MNAAVTKDVRMARVLGAVLTGGRSLRFGSDKGAALFDGVALADHAAAAIAPFVAKVVHVGGADGIADVPGPGLGPLGGIAAALGHAVQYGFDGVLTIGCDMPRVPEGLIAALLVRAPSYCTDAPVLGHWPVSAFDALRERLGVPADAGDQTGLRPLREDKEGKTGPSIKSWAAAVGALPIASPQPIANVNTPADLLAL